MFVKTHFNELVNLDHISKIYICDNIINDNVVHEIRGYKGNGFEADKRAVNDRSYDFSCLFGRFSDKDFCEVAFKDLTYDLSKGKSLIIITSEKEISARIKH